MTDLQADQKLDYPKAPDLDAYLMQSPWRGPVSRAVEALIAAHGKEVRSPAQFLDYLGETFPEEFSHIQDVSFYRLAVDRLYKDCQNIPSEPFELRIAVIHTQPVPWTRRVLFETRQQTTDATGWYPLIQGARANLGGTHYEALMARTQAGKPSGWRDFSLGDLTSIRRVASSKHPDNFNAFLLEGSQGTLLLDTGFGVNHDQLGSLKAVFLSHMHEDHTGGLPEVARRWSVPVILSDPTARHIYLKQAKNARVVEQIFANAVIIHAPQQAQSTDGALSFFPVFHTPGSFGICYADPRGTAVFYPGDICLSNGFYQEQANDLFNLVSAHPAHNKYVLLDSVMARGKHSFVSHEKDIPETTIDAFISETRRDVFFLAYVQELSIYSYLLAWHKTQKLPPGEQPCFVLNDDLFELLGSLYAQMQDRGGKHLDPVVQKLWPTGVANFAESQRIYPLSALKNYKGPDRYVFFISDTDLLTNRYLKSRLKWSNLIRMAKLAEDEHHSLSVLCEPCHNILKVASPEWNFHSRESDLVSLTKRLNEAGVKVIFFHQSGVGMRDIVKRNRLDPEMAIACGDSPIELR